MKLQKLLQALLCFSFLFLSNCLHDKKQNIQPKHASLDATSNAVTSPNQKLDSLPIIEGSCELSNVYVISPVINDNYFFG